MTTVSTLKQTLTPQSAEALEKMLEERITTRTSELLSVDPMKISRVASIQGAISELKQLLKAIRG